MNYRKDFERCFEYIESRLKDELNTLKLASYIGYSVFHFCRIFYIYQEMSPMEYVLNRRLQAALVDILEGKKIIDIAYDYHFETASGFSKAFKRIYGMSPTQYKNLAIKTENNSKLKEETSYPIKVQIKDIDSFWIRGYSIQMDYISSKYGQGMVAFWHKFEIDNLEEKLYYDINPEKHGEIGIVIKDELSSSRHRYMLGVVSQNKDGPILWTGYQIAGGKYAVITTPPVDMTTQEDGFVLMIKNIWKYIFDQWFDTIEYKYDDTRNDFEYYDERCHYCNDAVMEIYIPIK